MSFTELPHAVELALRIAVVCYVSISTMAYCARNTDLTIEQAAGIVVTVAAGALALRAYQKSQPRTKCGTCGEMQDKVRRSLSGSRLSVFLQLEMLLATVYVLLAWCHESSIDTTVSWVTVSASVVLSAVVFVSRAEIVDCKDCPNKAVRIDTGVLGTIDVGSCKGPRD